MALIGVLGTGFLGRELLKAPSWGEGSFVTHRPGKGKLPGSSAAIKEVAWDWLQVPTWEQLPKDRVTLVLTVPPLLADPERERERLTAWGAWMRENRPGCLRLVYISSTGVYPDADGDWTEQTAFTPDSCRGKLRRVTEETLATFFDTRVIRPGGIYGPGRHLGLRITKGLPIPGGKQAVHRIHVADLAAIVLRAVVDETFPGTLNALDLDPAPSAEVAAWVIKQPFFQGAPGGKIHFKDEPWSHHSTKRRISRALLETLGTQFKYPTYREGLSAACLERR